MIWKKFLFISVFLSVGLYASPVFFTWESNSAPLAKKINACTDWDKKKGFQFKENHFDLIEFERVNLEMSNYAKQSGKDRLAQIRCILNLKISVSEREELEKSLYSYRDTTLSFFEYYNRWLYSFEKMNLMTPMDKKYTSELLMLKYDLYSLLHEKTIEILFIKEIPDKEILDSVEVRISSIYHSILKGNFEYYNAIRPELRKEILKKISD